MAVVAQHRSPHPARALFFPERLWAPDCRAGCVHVKLMKQCEVANRQAICECVAKRGSSEGGHGPVRVTAPRLGARSQRGASPGLT